MQSLGNYATQSVTYVSGTSVTHLSGLYTFIKGRNYPSLVKRGKGRFSETFVFFIMEPLVIPQSAMHHVGCMAALNLTWFWAHSAF